MRRTYKASYTVEGSFIFSICILLIFFTLTMAISLYQSSYVYIDGITCEEIDAAKWFRRIAFGKEITSENKERKWRSSIGEITENIT